MTLTPPARLDSPTNLSRTEAAWRSTLVALHGWEIVIDLTSAPSEATGFNVRSTFTLQTHEASEGLWLDFLGEEVTEVEVDGTSVPVVWDGARVSLPYLAEGEHRVAVDARGHYSNSGQGLHRFHDPVDENTYLYTHFEPSDARRAWPCWDQPDLKSPVSLTVVHPEGWTILANGIATEKRASTFAEGMEVTTFSTTQPLPSYLTALAAGPWHRVSRKWAPAARPEVEPVELSWSCRASLAEHLDAEELLSVTAAGMDFYDAAYAYPYPWGSYDSVLVPEYNIGAMENPGCVTFNESAYLFQGPVTRAQHAGRANTIMHEMCHMWFGDLVTPRWWEDTWLKESFAENQGTWAQAEATEWPEAWATFALGRKAWAYAEDSRPATTHPIMATVEDVEAARQTFDGITYAKGAAVLKQLVAYVGQDAFLAAARTWFSEHAFGNGDLSEFLETLSRASGRDMSAWAQAWLGTSGPSILAMDVTSELDLDPAAPGTGTGASRITHAQILQESTDPATGKKLDRPHSLVVGLYSFDAEGTLTRTHRIPVQVEGAVTSVPQMLGLPTPDLITLNDEDLTYAVIRPDAASLATAQLSLARLADPLAKAVWWSSLDNLVRDALMKPADFIRAVLRGADDATAPAALTHLLARARTFALDYTEPSTRGQMLAPLVGVGEGAEDLNAWALLEAAAPGSDAQLVRARAWIEAASQASLIEGAMPAVAERLRSLLAGSLEGLHIDHDLRWRGLIALARLGEVTEAELAAALEADPSASGRIHAREVGAATPTAERKEEVFEQILADTSLSNDHLDALISGFQVPAHRDLTAPYTARYLASLTEVWAHRGQEIATRIVAGLFPSHGDAEELAQVRTWLEEYSGAPAALRRLLLKGCDDLDRALRARAHSV